MKNKILLGVLASSVISGVAMADMYVGVEYGSAKNTTDQSGVLVQSVSGDNNYKDIKVKIGAGRDGGVKFQGTVSFISFDEYVFSDKSKKTIDFGFDIIKEFEVTQSVYPFLKIGMGVGSIEVQGYDKDSITGTSINVGAGVSYKVVDHLYLLAGVDYVGRMWQGIEQQYYISRYNSGTTTIYTTDSAVKPYIGMNYKF